MDPFVFPKWTNSLRIVVGVCLALGAPYMVCLAWYAGSPRTTDVGYAPEQPIPYSHAVHAGDLGIDCRYCHNTVEEGARAAIPPTQTCMNCHAKIRPDAPTLVRMRESHATGMPIMWVRVHDLPDFVYFNHSAHVRRGVGCVSCHGRVDTMEVVYQAETLSMAWCLDCHRRPDAWLRPLTAITKMDWTPPDGEAEIFGAKIRADFDLNPSQDCSTCHR